MSSEIQGHAVRRDDRMGINEFRIDISAKTFSPALKLNHSVLTKEDWAPNDSKEQEGIMHVAPHLQWLQIDTIGKILKYYPKVIKYERIKQVIFQIVISNHLKLKRLINTCFDKKYNDFNSRLRILQLWTEEVYKKF